MNYNVSLSAEALSTIMASLGYVARSFMSIDDKTVDNIVDAVTELTEGLPFARMAFMNDVFDGAEYER